MPSVANRRMPSSHRRLWDKAAYCILEGLVILPFPFHCACLMLQTVIHIGLLGDSDIRCRRRGTRASTTVPNSGEQRPNPFTTGPLNGAKFLGSVLELAQPTDSIVREALLHERLFRSDTSKRRESCRHAGTYRRTMKTKKDDKKRTKMSRSDLKLRR